MRAEQRERAAPERHDDDGERKPAPDRAAPSGGPGTRAGPRLGSRRRRIAAYSAGVSSEAGSAAVSFAPGSPSGDWRVPSPVQVSGMASQNSSRPAPAMAASVRNAAE